MSSFASKQFTQFQARAAAILTTGAVDSAQLPISNTLDGWVTVYVDFTLGSLTNATFDAQLNDGTGWYSVTSPGVLTLTANGHKAFSVCAKGAKLLKVVATGSGTTTSSSATVKFGYQIPGGALGV